MPYTKRRIKLINQFGGSCQVCGYNKSIRALHFHHLDSSEKYSEKWGQQAQLGRATILEIETHPERFMLICANCHAELHDKEAQNAFIYTTCQHCGKEFKTEAHRASVGRDKFCSKECIQLSRDAWALSFESIEKRFWKYAIVQDGCWDWTGKVMARTSIPYLQIKKEDGKYTMKVATRISYQIHFGEPPQDKQVTRTCGNPKCLNPEHLTLRKSTR